MKRNFLLLFRTVMFAAVCLWCGAGAARGQGGPPPTGQEQGYLGVIPSGPGTVAAAPEYDSYDTPATLVTGVEWEGSNADATGTPGELTPPLVAGTPDHSVWFTWTAAETGWHGIHVNMDGLYIDGYLAVWRENGTEAPTFVLKRDLGGSVYLQAEAGDRYRICAANEPQPYLSVYVRREAQPPALEITSFALLGEEMADGVVDTGAGAVRGTVRFGFRASQVPGAWVLSFPGLEKLEFQFDNSRLVSGTKREGVCEVPFEIPAYLTPRRIYFQLGYRYYFDHSVNMSRLFTCGFMGETPFSVDGPPASLELVNTGKVDRTPPALTNCAAENETIDFDNAYRPDGMFGFSFTTADESGVARLMATLRDVDGGHRTEVQLGYELRQAGSVPATLWQWRDHLSQQSARPGVYELVVSCEDYNGNRTEVRSRDAAFPGPFREMRVTYSYVEPQYPGWRKTEFPGEDGAREEVSGETADPDGDGFPNFAEYALGLPPRTPNADRGIALRLEEYEPSMVQFTYTRPRRELRQEVRYEVQRAATPAGPWTRVEPAWGGTDLVSQETEAVRQAFPLEAGRRFFRLAVTK